jgi:homoserine dehydrogenase
MSDKQLTIGLFGYGVVGTGVYDILNTITGLPAKVKKICAKHPEKTRNIDQSNFTFDKYDLLNDPEINLIVEVIDDAKAAFEIVCEAMKKGKNVVTANKKMLAENMQTLIELQEATGARLLYEAASCGSIPIIRNLEEYYDNDLLTNMEGIFNGSTNYILSRIFEGNKDYDIALKQAQDLGFVENDPTLDIIGQDALYKMVIAVVHAYGLILDPKKVVTHGIQNISSHDIEYARQRRSKFRHIAVAEKNSNNEIHVYVLPKLVAVNQFYFHVRNEDNCVVLEGDYTSKQYFQGKGAGSYPTGSAVVSDISAQLYDYKYGYKKYKRPSLPTFSNNKVIEVYFRYYSEGNLQHFKFDKIKAKYTSKEYNYLIADINLQSLLDAGDKLNSADIFIALL